MKNYFNIFSQIKFFCDPLQMEDFFKQFKVEFDFNKVKEFYKKDIPNFDLMLKIHEVEYPQNNSELCTFLFKMLELFFKSMNYSSVLYKTDAQALVKKYPKLHQYIQERFDNHEYKLAQDGFFTDPGCFNTLKYENVMDDGIDTVALKLLTNECLQTFMGKDYHEFLRECCIKGDLIKQ